MQPSWDVARSRALWLRLDGQASALGPVSLRDLHGMDHRSVSKAVIGSAQMRHDVESTAHGRRVMALPRGAVLTPAVRAFAA